MPRNTTPLHALPEAVAFAVLTYISWEVSAWLVGTVGALLLACRFGRWLKANDPDYLEALAGGLPFALMLLIVAQLK